MDTTLKYFSHLMQKIEEVKGKQIDNIKKAAYIVSKSCEQGGRLYTFGSGHSHILAEEVYLRAGGLACVNAILPPELMLHEMPNKSTLLERLEGYASILLKLYKVSNKDTLIIISNSGINNVSIEMALEAHKIGVKVIALTSLKHSNESSSRNITGKHLNELADIVIDNCADLGDASFYIDGIGVPTGATSNITGSIIMQTLIVTIIDYMIKDGFNPDIFKSSNLDNGDEYNNTLFEKYYKCN